MVWSWTACSSLGRWEAGGGAAAAETVTRESARGGESPAAMMTAAAQAHRRLAIKRTARTKAKARVRGPRRPRWAAAVAATTRLFRLRQQALQVLRAELPLRQRIRRLAAAAVGYTCQRKRERERERARIQEKQPLRGSQGKVTRREREHYSSAETSVVCMNSSRLDQLHHPASTPLLSNAPPAQSRAAV